MVTIDLSTASPPPLSLLNTLSPRTRAASQNGKSTQPAPHPHHRPLTPRRNAPGHLPLQTQSPAQRQHRKPGHLARGHIPAAFHLDPCSSAEFLLHPTIHHPAPTPQRLFPSVSDHHG